MTTDQRHQLSKEDYYELRTRIRDVEAVEFDAMKAAQEFNRLMVEATQRRNATFEALATRYALDAKATYRWDDANCELIAVASSAEQ